MMPVDIEPDFKVQRLLRKLEITDSLVEEHINVFMQIIYDGIHYSYRHRRETVALSSGIDHSSRLN